jgi:hypothetical protein
MTDDNQIQVTLDAEMDMDVQAIVERFASLEKRMEKVEIEYGWRARAEAAEARAAELEATMTIDMVRQANARAEAAQAELEVTRDILRGVEAARPGWYQDVMDYLETLE